MKPNSSTIPPHVDPGAVFDFDFYSDRRFFAEQDVHKALLRMAEEEGSGIFWTPHNGGHWFINDHAMLFEAMRDTDLFSSAAQNLPPMPKGQEPRVIPVSLDGDEHAAYRLPLLKAFAPARVKAMKSEIRRFTVELIERVQTNGQCDFVEMISEQLPVVIFMKFMGLDTARAREFRTWIADMLSPDDASRASSHVKILGMLSVVIDDRRAVPRDDLISRLIASEVSGRPIELEELLAYCLLLFAAGLDTVTNSLSFGMHYLSRNPELQDRLRADPALIPAAVEELLRLHGITNHVRIVTRNAEWHGANLKKGDRALMVLAAGNLDRKYFSNPGSFDLDRENQPHVTFGIGPHRCVGSHLARMELYTFYEEWFKRMPNVAIAPGTTPQVRGGQTLALGTLPLIWDSQDARVAAS